MACPMGGPFLLRRRLIGKPRQATDGGRAGDGDAPCAVHARQLLAAGLANTQSRAGPFDRRPLS